VSGAGARAVTGAAALPCSDADLSFELPGGARVLFTDRSHGNLSSVGGDGAEHGAAARERLRALIGVRALVRGYQVHGTRVRRVRAEPPAEEHGARVEDADGQATALAGVATMVLAADCLPVALCDGGAVAVLHAGWRGLAAGVLEEGVRALGELGELGELGGARGGLVAVVGPGAGTCCYEVGPEVHAALGRPAARAAKIDLRAIARERLAAAGVADVRDVTACTICDERFFSHRREGSRAGRQAGLAWLS
jgi:YfiH family protein